MKSANLVERIDELADMGNKALATRQRYQHSGGEYLNSGMMAGFRAAVLSFIHCVYGNEHPHYTEFNENVNGVDPSNAERGISILDAIRSEIEGGWLFNLKGLITAEVFADFIEMAEHLLESGYKDPAAVMCGSVLEEHLRQLCTKHSIATEIEKENRQIPKKADRLNSDLVKNEVYSKLDQKMITAWLDLRNKAAHGKYGEYTENVVKNMLASVTEFMVRVAV